jgi:hypothetical protein
VTSSVDDYAKYLLEEARSPIAALHHFRILYDPDIDGFHFFFEGEEDSLFYMPEARRRLGIKQTYVYDCGGKKNVIEVRDSIEAGDYDLAKCLFFVDRDYDDLLGCQVVLDKNTYMTDSYSIENEIPNEQVTSIIISDLLRISQADPEFNRIKNMLSDTMANFYRKILPLSAWIIAAKMENCGPNLGNTIGLKGIVTLAAVEPVIIRVGFDKFKNKVVVNGKSPANKNVIKWARILVSKQAKKWVRGKYDVWFYRVALLAALEVTNADRKSSGRGPVRVPQSIREGRFFEALGGRVPVPTSLSEFYSRKLH